MAFPYHRFLVEVALCATTTEAPPWTGELSCDLQQALPGMLLAHTSSLTVSGIATGIYSLRVEVRDRRTGQPGVRLQSEGEDASLRIACGPIVLASDPAHSDSNGDSVPDLWYLTYGLDPTNPSVGGLDQDGDGSSNRDE